MGAVLSGRRLVSIIVVGLSTMHTLHAGRPAAPWYADKANLMVYIDANGQEQPVRTPDDWAKRRAHILANMQVVMGPFPDDSKKVPLDIKVLEEVKLPKSTRKKITFATEKGDRAWAYLFVPHGIEGKAPAMLCVHPTHRKGKDVAAGLTDRENRSHALELAQRGYVTIAPDYLNAGDYKCDWQALGYTSATMKGIWNHMRAVDVLASLPEVDPARIGCIGHSLGGHNTLFVGVFDPRIKAMVSSCGFNSFHKYMKGNLKGWSHNGYMPLIASRYGCDPAKMPFDFTEIVGALAPRPLFVNAPLGDSNFEVSGVKDCIRAATPVYKLLGGEGKLVAKHPDSGHDFPPAVRFEAYAFLDKVLGHTPRQ